MSALTRRDSQTMSDLFDWLEAPYALLRPFAGRTLRTEEGVEDGRYVVRVELPGIDPEKQAEVTLSGGTLTIHADREEKFDGKHRSEFRYGSFTRRVTLPANADETDAEANYEWGILEVSVGLKAKNGTADVDRRIPIRVLQHIEPT
ncbi:MAG TPA: Hsp20/alpha crystallin family protein [Streptosporangiaceae bacterium]|nr:Hsp20/alpha crystallin family protein [Streptosporangiaceae bacterium]